MEDFILCSPFNGFPFVLETQLVGKEAYYAWTVSVEEAVKLYWLSNIYDINVDINISITEADSETVNIVKNFSTACYSQFMGYFSPIPTEPYLRAINSSNTFMYSFFEDTSSGSFSFYISTPIYQDDDNYLIKFWGGYSFSYDGYGFELHIGLADIDSSYVQKFDFTMSIYGKEIPCILLQTYGKSDDDDITMSASASIISEYIE